MRHVAHLEFSTTQQTVLSTRRPLTWLLFLVTLTLIGCGGGGNAIDDTQASDGETITDAESDDTTPSTPDTDQPEISEINVLGFNWIYTAQLSPCPHISAYFPTTQLESTDGVLINSWLRTNGNLISSLTCAPVNHSFQRIYIGGVGATDPLNRDEIARLIKAATASHYGISPASIALSDLSVTADAVSWTSSVSAYGQTLSESTVLVRGEQL